MAWAFSSGAERKLLRNGWKPKASPTSAPSMRACGMLHLGRKSIPPMNKSGTDSLGRTTVFFCVSLNPAMDTRLVLHEFQVGRINRVSEAHRAPGGKAAHVAMALQALGATPKWVGFAGGASGNELMEGLRRLKIEADAVHTAQGTRVNLEIIDTRGGVTEIL